MLNAIQNVSESVTQNHVSNELRALSPIEKWCSEFANLNSCFSISSRNDKLVGVYTLIDGYKEDFTVPI